jgi:uncharacterized membrane protein
MSDMRYVRHGDVVITKGMLALITVVMLLIGAIATVVATGSTINSDLQYLKQEQVLNKNTISILEEKITACEKHIVSADVYLEQIRTDILTIKLDIKEMLRK